ncbi:MAG TPA: hypothetical protein VNU97_17165 [Rhizomicrobium sp.]|jgi:hypothetical protein|nr:hypothetical protein [Rhizomicrobium sp.]
MHWLDKVLVILESETADLRELAKLVGGEPEIFYLGTRLSGVDLRGQDLRGMKFTDLRAEDVRIDEKTQLDPEIELSLRRSESTAPEQSGDLTPDIESDRTREFVLRRVRRIKLENRQETRLALLLRDLLSMRIEGYRVLKEYGADRAEFTNGAIEMLRRLPVSPEQEREVRTSIVCNVMDYSIGYIYGMRKGILLQEFAKYLSEFDAPRALLREKIDRTRSLYVQPLRERIEESMRNPYTGD